MIISTDGLPFHLKRVLDDLLPALERSISRERTRRRRLRIALVSVAALAAIGGAAGAAGLVLGEPAPPAIRDDFTAVNRGLPPDLRLSVDAAGAKSVATTGASTLYLAKVRGGGYCMELTTGHARGRGVGCTTPGRRPIDVMVPHDEPMTTESPVTLAGQIGRAHV